MSIFGPIIAPPNIEDAIVTHLQAWMPTYLAELEDQNVLTRGALLRPPHASSVYGGVDFDSWSQDDLPAYIVTVRTASDPDRSSDGYGQMYAVGVAVVVAMRTEHEARRMAGFHGAAVMGAITQRPNLGGIATGTTMVEAPEVSLPDDDLTVIARCTAVYHVYVDQIIQDSLGPAADTPPESVAYAGNAEGPWTNWPTVLTQEVTVTPVEELTP